MSARDPLAMSSEARAELTMAAEANIADHERALLHILAGFPARLAGDAPSINPRQVRCGLRNSAAALDRFPENPRVLICFVEFAREPGDRHLRSIRLWGRGRRGGLLCLSSLRGNLELSRQQATEGSELESLLRDRLKYVRHLPESKRALL